MKLCKDLALESLKTFGWILKLEENPKLTGKWESFKIDSKIRDVNFKFRLED